MVPRVHMDGCAEFQVCHVTPPMPGLPKVTIEYCAKCKWHNRAVWYLLEVLQTFSDPEKNLVAEVAVRPRYDQPGMFQVIVASANGSKVVYRRRMKKTELPQDEEYYYDGFPDSKLLKVLIRNELFPELGLGHVDGHGGRLAEQVNTKPSSEATEAKDPSIECVACEKEQ